MLISFNTDVSNDEADNRKKPSRKGIKLKFAHKKISN